MKNKFKAATCTLRGTERAYTAFLNPLVGYTFHGEWNHEL
jgi:hypothetical protein